MGDSEDEQQIAEQYDFVAEGLWEMFELLQTEHDIPNDVLITCMIMEVQRYCRLIGFNKRDMSRTLRQALMQFDDLTPPRGVMMGEEPEYNALDAIKFAPDKKK